VASRGGPASAIFGLSLLVVFLLMAALYGPVRTTLSRAEK
jgi:hypothetical protein